MSARLGRRGRMRSASAMLADLGTRAGTERVLDELFGAPEPRCPQCGSTAHEACDRTVRAHPPVNGCTLVGMHACILTTGRPVPTVLELAAEDDDEYVTITDGSCRERVRVADLAKYG